MVLNSLKDGDTNLHTFALTSQTNKSKRSKPLTGEKGWYTPGLKTTAKSNIITLFRSFSALG